jgi:hypothetical protein
MLIYALDGWQTARKLTRFFLDMGVTRVLDTSFSNVPLIAINSLHHRVEIIKVMCVG